MHSHKFLPSIKMYGQAAHTLEDAGFLLRQHGLKYGNIEEWRLGRRMRDAETPNECAAFEVGLRSEVPMISL